MSSGQVGEASSVFIADPPRLHYCLNYPLPSSPLKNCLPWNRFRVTKSWDCWFRGSWDPGQREPAIAENQPLLSQLFGYKAEWCVSLQRNNMKNCFQRPQNGPCFEALGKIDFSNWKQVLLCMNNWLHRWFCLHGPLTFMISELGLLHSHKQANQPGRLKSVSSFPRAF